MKIVNTERNSEAKKEREILHKIEEKKTLSKKNNRRIPKLSQKKYKIAEGRNTVTKGAVTYGKPPPAIDRDKLKSRLGKEKSKLSKIAGGAKKGANAVVQPAKKVSSAATSALEKAAGGDNIEAVQLAKTSAAVTKNAAKTTVRAAKKSVKAVYSVVTKRGRKKLVKNVKKRVTRVPRAIKKTARTVKKTAKFTAKTVKFTAKAAAKIAKAAVKAVVKVVQILISTAPWSFIILAVAGMVVMCVYFLSAAVSDEENKVVAGAMNPDEDLEDGAINLRNFDTYLGELLEENVLTPLKEQAAEFCGLSAESEETSDTSDASESDESVSEDEEAPEAAPAKRIFEINGKVFFPADEKTEEINSAVNSAAEQLLSEENIDKFLSLLKALKSREWFPDEDEDAQKIALEAEDIGIFEKADFVPLFGELNVNSGDYGDTFFIKTLVTTENHECPDKKCSFHESKDDCSEWVSDSASDAESGHCTGYCPSNHEKMTVELLTVEEYLEKTVSEIYEFDEDDEYRYEAFAELLSDIRVFIASDFDGGAPQNNPYNLEEIPFEKKKTPKFTIGKVELTLLIFIGIGTFLGMIFKQRGR